MAAKDSDDSKQDDQDTETSLDLSQTAIKKMIADARERGYITYDQLNAVLPPEQVSSDQIEDVMSMLSEMGIQITEEEEMEDSSTGGELVETNAGSREVALSGAAAETPDRTDDPVRMY
ncbi:MAG: RNA polymerase sigma factor region1.1 domain-containing protein, partial [Pseudorhodobacter sp.]